MLIKKEAIILKDRKTVFNIVNRVDLYKNFVPYCIKSEILNQEKEQMEARLDFNLKGLTTSFTTKNKINGNDSIVMELLDGPFKKLDGKWEFKEIGKENI